jgi:hypothetical protein
MAGFVAGVLIGANVGFVIAELLRAAKTHS